MATETNLGTVHVFPSEASFTANSASVGTSDLALVKYPEMDFVVESYQNGTNWYRKYKSGWLEQGGTVYVSAIDQTLTLLLPFANSNWTSTASGGTQKFGNTSMHDKTTTTCKLWTSDDESFNAGNLSWFACGRGA